MAMLDRIEKIDEMLKILAQRKKIISALMEDVIKTIPLGEKKLTNLWDKYIRSTGEEETKISQKFNKSLEKFISKCLKKGLSQGASLNSNWLEEYEQKGYIIYKDKELKEIVSEFIDYPDSYYNIRKLKEKYMSIAMEIESLNKRKEELFSTKENSIKEENSEAKSENENIQPQEKKDTKEELIKRYAPTWAIDFDNPQKAFNNNSEMHIRMITELSIEIINEMNKYYEDGMRHYKKPEKLEEIKEKIEAYKTILAKFEKLEKRLTKDQEQFLSQAIIDGYKAKGIIKETFITPEEIYGIVGESLAANRNIVDLMVRKPSRAGFDFITETMNENHVRTFYEKVMQGFDESYSPDALNQEKEKKSKEDLETMFIHKLIDMCNIDICENGYEQIVADLDINLSKSSLEYIKYISDQEKKQKQEETGRSR